MTAAEIEAAVEEGGPVRVEGQSGTIEYLGRTEVAYYLGLAGLASLTGVVLPPPDATIGDRKGWLPSTIDVWQKNRPGRGRWGERIPKD